MGVFYQILYCGLPGLVNGFAGVFLPIILLLPLLFIHALGAADIKLFSVIGCFLGGKKVIPIIVVAFIIGGVYAFLYLICKAVRKKTIPTLFNNFILIGKDFRLLGKVFEIQAIEKKKNTIYFSIPILFSVIAEMGGFY